MKKEFSTHWKGSSQPRKQRKYAAKAPLHIRRKFLGANLSKDLRKKHGRRSIEIRKGDTVRIMRGKFRKKQGKVTEINARRARIGIEGIQAKKQDGSKVSVGLKPSNLQIVELNMEDKMRMAEKPKMEGKK
jgi:large subunit ribosomal protein L24